jgi:cell division cycle 14
MLSRSILKAVIGDRLYACQNVDILPEGDNFRRFEPKQLPQMISRSTDEFTNAKFPSIVHFVKQLDHELEKHPSCIFFYCVEEGMPALKTAALMLGAYMILRMEASLDTVSTCFAWMSPFATSAYHVQYEHAGDVALSLHDCWSGLIKGRDLGWLEYPRPCTHYLWGEIDVEEYEHNDNPINGGVHEVVPGKILTFQCPRDIEGNIYYDDEHGLRFFSPDFYADMFADYGVKAVVRLTDCHYNTAAFAERGMACHHIDYEDCIAPPPEALDTFLRLVDDCAGMVAVHCGAGPERTGTLAALYLMRTRGFTAREAVGWLRMMRPGSVTAEQQEYLLAACAPTAKAREWCGPEVPEPGSLSPGGPRRGRRGSLEMSPAEHVMLCATAEVDRMEKDPVGPCLWTEADLNSS